MSDFDDSGFGGDDAYTEVRPQPQMAPDAPQNAREAAVQKIIQCYQSLPGDTSSLAERRERALGIALEQFAQAGQYLQQSTMRSLMVQSLLDSGQITRLPAEESPSASADAATEAARSAYVKAICDDARLAARLVRKMESTHPAQAGESAATHLERLGAEDFDKGFNDCEYPTIHETVTFEAARSHAEQQLRAAGAACDSDGVVDEARVQRENMHLIEQALRLQMRSEDLTMRLNQPLTGVEFDGIDLSALELTTRHVAQSGGDPDAAEADANRYPRER